MKRSIAFVLPVRYPTEKAYGVTVGRTAEALRQSGYSVRIFAPSSVETDSFKNEISDISKILKKSYPAKKGNKLSIGVGILYDSFYLVLKMKKEFASSEVIIIREFALALIAACLLPRKKVMIEIHRSLNRFRRLLIALIVRVRGLKVLYISPETLKQFQSLISADAMCHLPMGVTTDFFRDGYDHDIELPIKMCFIGKETSSGVDNNLDQFISMLARSVARNSPVELYLVGLEGSSALRFQNYSNQFLEIKTIDHIDHTKLGEYLAQMDCGVIPYESNRYHAFRFPIKSLEYAAAGLIILVNRTQSISKIIPEDAAVFFSYDSKDSLRLALLKLLEKEEMEGVRLRASGWAMNFSYEKRARKLVSFLEINQSEKS